MEIIIKVVINDEGTVTVSQLKNETEEPKKIITDGNCEFSTYSRYFDEGCVGWTKDSEYNLCFLKIQQEYANELLKRRGHLFLNEVYDMLDIPRTKAGAVMGWIYDKEHPYGSNFVDFGLGSERNRDFINGRDNVALLDFNVDGNILDLI